MLDAAPLVNVVFLLLLFFVLNSQFVMQRGVSVDLASIDIPMTGSFQSLVVTVARDDMVFFNDQQVPVDMLEQTLREAVQQGRGRELIIRADKQVAQGTVMEIMGAAVRAGIPVVNIAARPGITGAPN